MKINKDLFAKGDSTFLKDGWFGVLLIFLCMATYVLYYPGILGPFLLDDSPNLQTLSANGGVTSFESLLRFVFSNESGRLGRPVAMLSFLINDQHWPSYSPSFKYTNVLIHLLIGVLVFIFTRQLIRNLGKNLAKLSEQEINLIALFAAAFWLFHPLNVSTTLYVVQRMTQLASLFSLIAIILYLHGRRHLLEGTSKGYLYIGLAFFPFGTAGLLSKENAVLFVPLILLIEFLLPGLPNNKFAQQFSRVKWGLLVVPLLLLVGYFVFNWDTIARGYQGREFDASERIMTEARVLCDYLLKIVFPKASGLTLLHDDFPLSSSLLNPISTLVAVIFLILLFLVAMLTRKKQPLFAFAVGWFFIGHLLESTLIPLEIYFEHRNYLPMIGPVIFLSYFLVKIFGRLFVDSQVFKILVLVMILAVEAMMLNISTRTWGDTGLLFYSWAIEHPESLRSQRNYAAYLEKAGLPDHAIKVLDEAYKVHPYDVSLLLAKLNIQCDEQDDEALKVTEIINAYEDSRFTDGILYHIEKLTGKVIAQECKSLTESDLNLLFDYLENLPLLAGKRRYAAKLYYLHASLYIHQRNLQGAMIKLDQVYSVQPTVDVALKQAVLLSSASLYDQALERIAAAKSANQTRRLLRPSRMDELEQFERYIRRKQKTGLDSE